MRGIGGIVHFDSRPISAEYLGRLVSAMALGRFDRITQIQDGPTAFAHLQRDLTPEDTFESQPLRSSDGNLWLVTDAILENRDDLATAFGWSLSETATKPDSAFVLAAYEKWGAACLNRLEGKWAFAIWHARERRLFAAVDHFAFRPFYYSRTGGSFFFASTLRALLALPEVGYEIDDEILGDFLLFTRSDPNRTLYRSIKVLPAAHFLVADSNGTRVTRYWRADPTKTLRFSSDAEYAEAFERELKRAVTAPLRVPGKVGVMLSGGLDSASVTAIAGDYLANEGRRLQAIHRLPPPGDPRTSNLREHDESAYVRHMQGYLRHIDFHFVPPVTERLRISLHRWNDQFEQHFGPLRGAVFDPPPTDKSDSPFDVDLILFGLGGNYTVSLEAYPSDYFAQLFVQLRWVRLAREVRGHGALYGHTMPHLIKHRVLAPLFGRRSSQPNSRHVLLNSLNPDFIRRANLRTKLAPKGRWQRENFSVKRREAWILNELVPQNRGGTKSVIASDYACAAHSPLMSHRLNEFCLSVPVEQQIRNGKDRLLLRKAMHGRLPEEVIWRTTRGFPTPGSWQTARAVVSALPEALAELEKSSLVAHYVDLRELRRRFATTDETELRRVGASRFLDLFNVAWFLQWLENSTRSRV